MSSRAAEHRAGPLSPRCLVVYTDATTVAGAERAIAIVVAQLPPEVEVIVAGPDEATTSWIAAHRGLRPAPVVALPPLGCRADWRQAATIREALRGLGPATLHLNKTDVADLRYVELLARSIRSLRIVSVVHHIEPVASGPGRMLTRGLARGAGATVAVSNRLARQLEDVLRLPRGRVITITNAVPQPRFRRHTYTGGPVTIGVLARLVPHKAVDDVVRAVAALSDVTLLVGGDGPERDRLVALARELGVADRVRYLGWVEPEAVLARCDVLASAARVEGHPLTLLDARAVGLPVVAVDVGGVDDIVTGPDVGRLVPPGQPGALLRALAGEVNQIRAGQARPVASQPVGDPVDAMVDAYHRLYWPSYQLAATSTDTGRQRCSE